MTLDIKLAHNLSLPLETVTQTIGILAKRRAGKSYLARRLAEQLFISGQQIVIVIVDPKGDQWGIRSAAEEGAPMHFIQSGLGHGSVSVTERYYARFDPKSAAKQLLRVIEGGRIKRKLQQESGTKTGTTGN